MIPPLLHISRSTTPRHDTSYCEVRATCAQCGTQDEPCASRCLVYGNAVQNFASPLTPLILAQAASGAKSPPKKTMALARRYANPMNWAMKEFGICTLEQRRAFVAVVVHETNNLRATVEALSSHASSQGRYKGRGLIQLTHEGNYKRCGEFFGLTCPGLHLNLFVDYPEIVAECPYFAAGTAAWYWRYATKWDLNVLIGDGRLEQFEKVCRTVNGGRPTGGLNHWEDRKLRYEWAKKYIVA